MSLSHDLISQFVKITKDTKQTKTETTVYGTTVEYDGRMFVKLDGSDLLTPVSTTADTKADERVMVTIKDHAAVVTGNLSSPAARTDDVKEVVNEVTEFDIVMSYKVTTEDLEAINATITSLRALTANITNADILNAEITNLEAKFASLEHVSAKDVEALNAEIENLRAKFIDSENISTEDLEAANAEIDNLKGYTADFTYVSADVLTAVKADIKKLNIDKASIKEMEAKYANINFSNIGEAAIKHLFADYGLIKDIIVSDGTITGELIGVTIKGDLIEAETLVADKLVVKGSDGLYYKLNMDAGVIASETMTEEQLQNGIHGDVLIKKSIVAEKIAVDDLIAFDATIGGFHIGTNSLYSDVKSSVDNTTTGIYLDTDGQANIGDSEQYIKYYKNEDGDFTLAVCAADILFGSSKVSVETAISDVQETATDTQTLVGEAQEQIIISQAAIQKLEDAIAMLVTDENGTSLMTQEGDNWTFNLGSITQPLADATEALNTLTESVGDIDNAINILQQAVDDLGVMADYVKITTYNDQPCIELGEADNDFKVRITNTEIQFADGTVIPAYFSNKKLNIEKAEVKDELQFGGFVFKIRANGNLGLMWRGEDE